MTCCGAPVVPEDTTKFWLRHQRAGTSACLAARLSARIAWRRYKPPRGWRTGSDVGCCGAPVRGEPTMKYYARHMKGLVHPIGPPCLPSLELARPYWRNRYVPVAK